MTEQISTETPENIIGRTPADIERQAINDGYIPTFRIGDDVEGNHATGNGRVDSLVLFKVQGGYVWACRFEGGTDYYPQDYLKKVATEQK